MKHLMKRLTEATDLRRTDDDDGVDSEIKRAKMEM
jgi:hypothetical protein